MLQLSETMMRGIAFAVICYVLYAAAMTAKLGLFFFFPILFVYSPVSGVYSFLEAKRTNSMNKSLAMGLVAVILFDAITIADSMLRGNFTLPILLLEFLPALAGALLLWVIAGTLWSGSSGLNARLHIRTQSLSHALSGLLFLSGVILWYFTIWIPFIGRFD